MGGQTTKPPRKCQMHAKTNHITNNHPTPKVGSKKQRKMQKGKKAKSMHVMMENEKKKNQYKARKNGREECMKQGKGRGR